jgi:hypothetical protein
MARRVPKWLARGRRVRVLPAMLPPGRVLARPASGQPGLLARVLLLELAMLLPLVPAPTQSRPLIPGLVQELIQQAAKWGSRGCLLTMQQPEFPG